MCPTSHGFVTYCKRAPNDMLDCRIYEVMEKEDNFYLMVGMNL